MYMASTEQHRLQSHTKLVKAVWQQQDPHHIPGNVGHVMTAGDCCRMLQGTMNSWIIII